MRIAAIDIGTNSIHMVIARATGDASFEVVDREREVVQIGKGSFEAGRLKAAAVRRTVEALSRFVDLARRQRVDKILCTATAAVREARNGGAFLLAARKSVGITPRVIPPEEEGRLIYLAVKSALQLDAAPSLIVDIGGGSVQLVVVDKDRLIASYSAPLGALRLTEHLVHNDPPGHRELQRLRQHIRRFSAKELDAVAALSPARVYGSSGSIHSLAQLAHVEETGETASHLNGYVLRRDALVRLMRRLATMTLAEREKLPGIDAKRAAIILPGAMVLAHVLGRLDVDAITISDFGVREGLVTDYLVSHRVEITALSDVEDMRLRSVLHLLQKFQPDGPNLRHARHVARLSLALFDGLRDTHGLGDEAREILHFAALLHDVGAVIGYDGHAQHSSYIIRNGSLRGVTATELDLIATVARFHGKARPGKRHPSYRSLDKRQRRMVKWLSALLRVAEGLDRSHYQLVQDVSVVRRGGRISLMLTVRRDARLELWAARRRTAALAKLLKVRLRVVPRSRPASATAGRSSVALVATARHRNSRPKSSRRSAGG